MRINSSEPKNEVTTTTIRAIKAHQKTACLRNQSSLRRKLSTRIRLGRRRRSRTRMRTHSIRIPTAIKGEVSQRSSRSSPPKNSRAPSRWWLRSQTSAFNPCRGSITTCSRWITRAVGRINVVGRVRQVKRVGGASNENQYKSQIRRGKRRRDLAPRRSLIMCTSRKTKVSPPGCKVSNALSKVKKRKRHRTLFNLI